MESDEKQWRWEVEPHPYNSDYDVLVTDDDHEALEALRKAVEMVWDSMELNCEATITLRYNPDVPQGPNQGYSSVYDIDTAPKDGTVILTDKGVARYFEKCFDTGWVHCDSSGSTLYHNGEIPWCHPAKWMPLPRWMRQ
jgi:hypothetical protein